jgi:transposase
MMEGTMLLQLPEGMLIDHIQATDTGLLIAVTATALTSRCPLCGEVSSSVHSSYCRSVRDVPCGGRRVQLCLMVRKFFCRNALCERKVFTEQLPSFVEPWARMTMRLCQALQAIGLATSGKGGTRLARRLSMHTSRQTVLRRVMDLPSVPTPSVLYLGVDDFSFRRGQWFGTILVDIERHRVIDVLPDRRAETVARWMRLRPEITVVSRDRGGEYASAAREGAPQALQCADRFHVVKNLTEAVQVLLARCQAEILAEKKPDELGQDEQNKPILSIEEWRPPEPAHVEKVRLARRAGRHARYEQVIELRQQGMKPQDIACQLGLSERTVRRWLAARAFPEARKRRKRQSSFDDFAPYILKRWQSGEHNGLVLWREIMAQGYTGTARSVYRHLETLKRVEVKASVNLERIQKYSPSTAVWLFVRDPHKLDTVEREDLVAYCQASSALSRAYQFTREFLTMVHKREGDGFDACL